MGGGWGGVHRIRAYFTYRSIVGPIHRVFGSSTSVVHGILCFCMKMLFALCEPGGNVSVVSISVNITTTYDCINQSLTWDSFITTTITTTTDRYNNIMGGFYWLNLF